MLCTVCNNEIKPELYNLKRGQGCWFCADSNKKYDENIGRLYLIHNHKENIIKVGITNESGNRMKKYNQDWKIIRYIQFSKGKTAYKYEKKVLNKWRNDLNLPIALSRDTRLLMDGYTETANESGLDDAIKIIDKCLFNKEATVVKLDRSC